jgi:hypothetical protein
METQLGALDAAHIINNKLNEAHGPKLSSNPQNVDTDIHQARTIGEARRRKKIRARGRGAAAEGAL